MEPISSLNSLGYLEPNLLLPSQPQSSAEIATEFEKLFLMQLAKQAFKNSFWGADDRLDTKIYQDLFVENFVNQMAEEDAFGLKDVIQERIENSPKFKKINKTK